MNLFKDLETSGSSPALEQMLRFSGARQRLLVHNIANIDTPDFIPLDVSPQAFQQQLAKAINARREVNGGQQGELHLESSDEVTISGDGALTLTPQTSSNNILYHDRNNRDLERMMQGLAENGLAFRTATELLRRNHDLLRSAIAQRA